MPIQAIERSATTLRIVVSEALTAEDVVLVRDALASGPRGAHVTVDLRGARTTEPPALLMLSRALADSGARSSFVGLTLANERLLRYLHRGASPLEDAHPPGG